jgi:hypothetical protein
MTQDEMIRLAKQAGWQYAHGDSGFEPLWEFAKLVAEKEREAILGLADSLGWVSVDHIRARGQA